MSPYRPSIPTIQIQIENFFDGLTEGFNDMSKHKDGSYLLEKRTRRRNGRKPPSSQNLKYQRVIKNSHIFPSPRLSKFSM